jgi:hypothetical protein
MKTNKQNVGLDALANRFHSLNGKIPLDWLINTYSKFKIVFKKVPDLPLITLLDNYYKLSSE